MTLLETSSAPNGSARPRTYEVRTFGCQMNVHDSERLSGSLEAAGYVRAEGAPADVVVINTCAVRENADNKLYGTLGHLASTKRNLPGQDERSFVDGFRGLKEIGFHDYMSLECGCIGDPTVEIPKSFKFLKDQWDQAVV